MQRMKVTIGVLAVLLTVQSSEAASMGIPLDGFLQSFQTWVIGLGLILGLVGLTGFVASKFDNPFSHVLSGSVGFFANSGLLGGGAILLGMVGLVGGALL